MNAPGTNPPVVLTIAGSDSGGAAGIAADLTTFAALGVHGTLAITAVTAQSTQGVDRVVLLHPNEVLAQLRSVLEDLPVAVVKTGMLGSAAIARAVVAALPTEVPLVVDPVLRATTGRALADAALLEAYRTVVLPRCTVATPNAGEAEVLGKGLPGGALPCATVVTERGLDCYDGLEFKVPVVETGNDHGTGCTHAAALAAYLAQGYALPEAARLAQHFVVDRLTDSAGWSLGRGRGPVSHLIRPADPLVPTQEP